MGDKTGIEWAEATWNPTVGCSLVSPGCTNCYAMRHAARLDRMGGMAGAKYAGLTQASKAGPVWNGTVRLDEEALDQPLRWKRPRRIFVNSMSDLFHESLSFGQIMRVFNVMWQCRHHTFLVLTKRADRMREFMQKWADLSGEDFELKLVRGPEATRAAHPSGRGQLFADMLDAMGMPPAGCAYPTFDWMGGMIRWPNYPLNLWLGGSVEDQARADERIPLLLATPAAVRFISAEPLLGPLDLWNGDPDPRLGGHRATQTFIGEWWEPFDPPKAPPRRGVDWVIAGGESGPNARPSHPGWFRSLRDQCLVAGVPFFFKQWGEWLPSEAEDHPVYNREHRYVSVGAHVYRLGKKRAGRLLDGRTWDEVPA